MATDNSELSEDELEELLEELDEGEETDVVQTNDDAE